jgi:hypothetical protein
MNSMSWRDSGDPPSKLGVGLRLDLRSCKNDGSEPILDPVGNGVNSTTSQIEG